MSDVEELETAVYKLSYYEGEGNYFHGSPNSDIEVLEPRLITGQDEFASGKAVWAARLASAAVIFSLVDFQPKDEPPKWGVTWKGESEVIAHIPIQYKERLESANGIVYVVPREGFVSNTEGQYKNDSEVTPVDSIKVNLNDFYELGGVVEWVVQS